MRLLLFIFFLFTTNLVVGQTNQFSVSQIESLVSSIDTVKGLRIAIADGTITPKGKRKPQGGFSDTYYLHPITDELLKIERGASLFTQDFTTYYFHSDSLILVRTAKHEIKSGKLILNGRYFFRNGVLFYRQEAGKPLSKPEAYLQHARLYLKDYKSMFGLK